jgi:glycosyltransferase involved in cell wall biosynthesis
MSARERQTIVADLTAVAAGLTLRAAHIAAERDFSEILFVTREGEFFLSVFNALRDAGMVPGTIGGRLFETSRQATYCASLSAPSVDELMRLWRQYRRQTPAALVWSLGEDPSSYEEVLAAHRLTLGETIADPWTDPRVLALIADPRFSERVMAASGRQRRALFGYLEREGLNGRDRLLMTDIGWRATIQDNLCLLLPECRITGVYVGLQRFLNPQPPNAEKRAVAGDMNEPGCSSRAAAALKFVTAMEMLCTSPRGTVTGYGGAPDYLPQREESTPESRTWRTFTAAIQREVIAQAPDFARQAERHPSSWIEESATRALQRLLLSPKRLLADEFARFVHDERFGDGHWDGKRRTLVRGSWRAAWDAERRRELREFLRTTSWPQGWLRASGAGALISPFNLLLRRKVATNDLAGPTSVEPPADATRVLHITGRSDHGGGPEHMLQLLRGATPETVSYVACPTDGIYRQRYDAIVGPRRLLPIPHRRFHPAALGRLAAFIKRERISLIHAHGMAGGIYGRLASRLTGVPCVYTFHGVPKAPSLHQEFYRVVEPAVARWTAAAVAVSEGERALILKRYPAYRDRVHVVPNGLEVRDQLPVRAPRPPGAPFLVVSFGRAGRQKNPELIVEIARRLRALQGPEVRFELFGDGVANRAMQALIDGAGVSVRCHPPRDDPDTVLASADFYLSTSRWEGLPMSLLEAWRAGTCVVATDVVGNRDVITHDRNGLLFPSEDAEAGARALLELMQQPERVDRLRQQAFSDCTARHGRAAMVERLSAVYRHALDGAGGD